MRKLNVFQLLFYSLSETKSLKPYGSHHNQETWYTSFANWSHNNQLPNDHNEKDWATKIRERSNGRGAVALSRLTHTWPFLTLQELWLLPLVLIAPRQSGAFLLLLSLSRPKSMEHEFRCVTNLLNLYNSINIINLK